MSQKRTIKLDLDAKDVVKKLENIEKELSEVKKGVEEGTEEMTRLGESTNLTATGMTGLAGQIGIVAVSLKALAIRTIYGAFDTFFNILKTNQKVLDATNKGFETMSIFTRSIVNDMVEVTTTGAAKGFFEQFQKALPTLRKTVDSLTNMSSKINILKTGFQLFGNIFSVKERITDAKDLADEIVNLRNEVMLAEAEQRLLQLTYQKEAEIQRQIRDDIRKTPEERKKANEKLGQILEQQLADELRLANERLRLAELVLSTDEDNIQFQVERTNALAEIADIEERITGQRSEQKTNEAALDQEIHDQRMQDGEEIITLDHRRIKSGKDLLDERIKQNLELLKNQQDTNTEEQEQAEQQRQFFEDWYENRVDFAQSTLQTLADIAQETLVSEKNALQEQLDAGLISQEEFEQESEKIERASIKREKRNAILQILIDTAQGVSAAIKAGAGLVFPANLAAIATGVATVLTGIASAKAVLNQVPGGGGGGGGENDVSTEVFGGGISGVIPNMETITPTGSLDTPPVQAFVIENDISNAQALQHELETQATL